MTMTVRVVHNNDRNVGPFDVQQGTTDLRYGGCVGILVGQSVVQIVT
jgi:hypothetical protein